MDYSGVLTIRTYLASKAVPVENALVVITDISSGETKIINSQFTNKNGVTENVTLPAPDPRLSEYPNVSRQGYSLYDVRIDKEGFYTLEFHNVSIFANQISIQEAEMIPLPDGELQGKTIFYIEEEPNLEA